MLTREALSGGQFWRLWSAHWLHLDGRHAGINWVVLAIVLASAVRWRLLRAMVPVALVVMPLLSLALLLWRPDLQWYVGLSGLLHALLVWLVLRHGGRVAWVGVTLIAIKLIGQAVAGTEAWVVQEAHWLGAVLGAAMLRVPRTRHGLPGRA